MMGLESWQWRALGWIALYIVVFVGVICGLVWLTTGHLVNARCAR